MPAPRSVLLWSSLLPTRPSFSLFSLIVFGGKSVSIVCPAVDVDDETRLKVVEESINLFRFWKVAIVCSIQATIAVCYQGGIDVRDIAWETIVRATKSECHRHTQWKTESIVLESLVQA